MSISDVEGAVNLLKLGLRNYKGEMIADKAEARADTENCYENLRYIAQTLRQNYDTLMRNDEDFSTEKFFLNLDGSGLVEVSREDYDNYMTETGENDEETEDEEQEEI